MDEHNKFSRREFIKVAALGAGALTLSAGGIGLIVGCEKTSQSSKNFFSEDEYHLLECISEQIIPTDEWPGGRDTGVVNFIDIQLVGPYSRYQQDYRKGLAAIESTCLDKYGKKFEQLSWNTQTGFLQDMEGGRLSGEAWSNGFSEKFFELLRSHSMQAYYGSPRHGGNRNFVSFKMMGLDDFQIVGQNRYGV
jgi:gluconate 2-dehydrogenase gamma chain